jgi:hypothetical protein
MGATSCNEAISSRPKLVPVVSVITFAGSIRQEIGIEHLIERPRAHIGEAERAGLLLRILPPGGERGRHDAVSRGESPQRQDFLEFGLQAARRWTSRLFAKRAITHESTRRQNGDTYAACTSATT